MRDWGECDEIASKNNFIETFLTRYAPQNVQRNRESIREGMFGNIPFIVFENNNTYGVIMKNKKKIFTCAYNAAMWIKKQATLL